MSNDDHGGGAGYTDGPVDGNVDSRVRQLPSIFALGEMVKAQIGEEAIVVSETISKAAVFYEKIRNTLEYDEEHLLRRNAIRRVLKRRLGVDVEASSLAKDLLTELIWARYLPNEEIPARMIDEVAVMLTTYEPLMATVPRTSAPGYYFNWLLDLLAHDVESLLVPPSREDAFASFMFCVIQDHIEWKKGSLPEDQRELQLFLAVHRTLLKADPGRLRARVFHLYHPEWRRGPSQEQITTLTNRLEETVRHIESQVTHPISEPLSREVRRYAILFNVLIDVCAKNPDEFLEIVSSPEKLNSAVSKATEGRVKKFRSRLTRLVVRAVLFLFITKMLLALALEFPYDLLISHETSFMPLVINIAFPPFLLAFIGLSVRIPGKKNVKNIQSGVRAVVYGSKELKLVFKVKKPWSRSASGIFFNALYGFTFLFTYGIIAWALGTIGFNIVSTLIFLFFLSLVTFFGIRIRRSIREVYLDTGKPTILGAFVDIFTLPIVRVGRWISLRAPRVNVFLFFMDFIIEAPFKMAIEVIESWLAFMREKKEEVS
ncbi:MAG: hypothetical protein AAB337_02230 [Patescibacteria group bacterium]|mgnify:CR=1 FL=1